ERTKREVEAARLEQAQTDYERAARAVERLEWVSPQEEEVATAVAAPPAGPIEVYPGATVWLRGISTPGEALAEPDADGAFEAQLGPLRTRVRLDQVEHTGEPVAVDRLVNTTISVSAPIDSGPSIEVRGQTLAEALPKVEKFLERAVRSGRPRVLLIHGKGT